MANNVDFSAQISDFLNSANGEDVRDSLVVIARALQAACNNQLIQLDTSLTKDGYGANAMTTGDAIEALRLAQQNEAAARAQGDEAVLAAAMVYRDTIARDNVDGAVEPGWYKVSGENSVVFVIPQDYVRYQVWLQNDDVWTRRAYRNSVSDAWGAWSDWSELAKQADVDDLKSATVMNRGPLGAYMGSDWSGDWHEVMDPGVYFVTEGTLHVNAPFEGAGTLIVFVAKNVNESVRQVVQVFVTGTRTTIHRYGGSVWSEWVELSNVDLAAEVADFKAVVSEFYEETWNLYDGLAHGQLGMNATAVTAGSTAQVQSAWCPVKPSTTYTIQKMSTSRFRVVCTADPPAAGVAASGYRDFGTKSIGIYTTPATAAYLVILYHGVDDEDIDEADVRASLQVEEGRVATAYTPHFTAVDYVARRGADQPSVVGCDAEIPSTTAGYYALWSDLLSAGYCTRNSLATVQGVAPIYEYVFEIGSSWLNGSVVEQTDETQLYDRPTIGLIGGIHGDERAVVMFIHDFVTRFCTEDAFAKYRRGIRLRVLPVANPWGFDNDERGLDSEGTDLNRLAGTATAAEYPSGVALSEWLGSHNFDVVVDLHQTTYGKQSGRPEICSFLTLPRPISDSHRKILSLQYQAGAEQADAAMARNAGVENAQRSYVWIGSTNDTWRNWAENNLDNVGMAVSAEFSRSCYYYSGSSVDFNPLAMTYGNTLVNAWLRRIMDDLLNQAG